MCPRVPPGAPGCPREGVGRVPRGVVEPPGGPGGRGEGSYGGRKSFEEKMCDEKNEKMQKLGSGEVPQGPRSMESCALMWGTRGLASRGLGTPFRGHFRGPTGGTGGSNFGAIPGKYKNLLVQSDV